MIQNLWIDLDNGVKVAVVTRPSEDFKEKYLTSWQTTTDLIKSSGIAVVFKSNIHQKFAVVDQKSFLVRQHQPAKLWQCRGKHNATRKFEYR
jgi:hypothetical protein